MGRTRRIRVTLLLAGAALILALAAAACSGGDAQAEDLLLSADDFPGIEMAETIGQSTVTELGVSAAQVDLNTPDFTLTQSVTVFQTAPSALAVLASIKQDQSSQGVPLSDLGQFQDVSGIITELRGGEEFLTLFFIEGRALVRLTISGPERQTMLPIIAEQARDKASHQ